MINFDTYRDYIISLLKVTPDLNDTAVLYRVPFTTHIQKQQKYYGY